MGRSKCPGVAGSYTSSSGDSQNISQSVWHGHYPIRVEHLGDEGGVLEIRCRAMLCLWPLDLEGWGSPREGRQEAERAALRLPVTEELQYFNNDTAIQVY